jgi:hypothetical protein
MGDGVLQESVEDCRAGSVAARVRGGCHATYTPGAWLAVGCDEADGDQCSAMEGADRECAGRLVARQALNRFVGPQNRKAERSSLSNRNRTNKQVSHDTNARASSRSAAKDHWCSNMTFKTS